MGPQPPLDPAYRIHVFPETDAVAPADVVAYWEGEGAITGDEARRRVDEVLLVATGPDDAIVGVSSVFLERNPQLRMDLWYYRTYVSGSHRRSQLARHMVQRTVAMLEERFVSGEDVRGVGIGIVGQNEELRRARTEAVTPRSRFVFIGETHRGHRVRVRYFPGAVVPPAPEGSATTPR